MVVTLPNQNGTNLGKFEEAEVAGLFDLISIFHSYLILTLSL